MRTRKVDIRLAIVERDDFPFYGLTYAKANFALMRVDVDCHGRTNADLISLHHDYAEANNAREQYKAERSRRKARRASRSLFNDNADSDSTKLDT